MWPPGVRISGSHIGYGYALFVGTTANTTITCAVLSFPSPPFNPASIEGLQERCELMERGPGRTLVFFILIYGNNTFSRKVPSTFLI